MTARLRRTSNRLALGAIAAACAVLAVACGGELFEVPIETPIRAKLDVSAFQRVLVAGFVAGGNDELDTNQETVRLLRSQLRTKSPLRVIEAEVLPLAEVAAAESAAARDNGNTITTTSTGVAPVGPIPAAEMASKPADSAAAKPQPDPHKADPAIHNEKDLAKYDKIFADVAYGKKLGEEYQTPLIVTGTVLFTPNQANGFVMQQREVYDSFGRRSVIPVRTYQERKGFILQPRFVFIDGRTGAILYSETFHEEILYPAQQSVPALSTYFELMDRVMPSFLSTLSAQKIRGTRVLLK